MATSFTLPVIVGLIPLDATTVELECQTYVLADLMPGQAYTDGPAFGIDGYFTAEEGIAAFHVAVFTASVEDGDYAECLIHRGTHIEYWGYGVTQ
jgi:hypothetical protein